MVKRISSLIISTLALLFFTIPTTAYAQETILRPITFPVNGPSSFRDDFGDPRESGTREHLGVDIIADKLTPVVAAVDGRVVYVVSPQASWGYSISIQDSEGYTYRYLHLNNDTPGTDDGNGGEVNAYAPGIREGVMVTKGQHVGWVGDSGNAENTISHLHFEIRKPDRSAINPYPSLVEAARTSLFSASIRVGVATPVANHADGASPIDGTEYYFTENLSLGSRGIAVSALQTRLKTAGYFTSYITEYFGPITQAALIKYQTVKGLAPTGVLDALTRGLLNDGLTPPIIAPPSPGTPYIFTQNLSVGSNGEEVRQLQILLKGLGYFRNTLTTGYFGSITKTAVIAFQKANGLTATGVVERITRVFLNGCTSNAGYSVRTGKSCAGTLILPAGCTSIVGYSPLTGQSCGTSI